MRINKMLRRISSIPAKRLIRNTGQLKGIPSLILGNISFFPHFLKGIAVLKNDTSNNETLEPLFLPDKNPRPFNLENEREELISRANYLIKEVANASGDELIDKMPDAIGRFYQGEWAIYAAAMTVVALSQIHRLYPENTGHFLGAMRRSIEMMMSPAIKFYDSSSWREDPLTSLAGDKSHMTYLSLLAWAIGNYRKVTSDNSFNILHQTIIETLARRMKKEKYMNLPSFPNGIVFLPDMMYTLLALRDYGKLHNHEYDSLVKEWVELQKRYNLDSETGLLISNYYKSGRRGRLSGAYSALNTSCLCLLDREFGLQQYQLLKHHFMRHGKYAAIREFIDHDPEMTFDIDAGPVIMGISPSGTSFALGAATILGDRNFREGLLRTAELAGHTIRKDNTLHYQLAEIMLTGEAITLAMRTLTL